MAIAAAVKQGAKLLKAPRALGSGAFCFEGGFTVEAIEEKYPFFDGYPYLVIRITTQLYHINLLTKECDMGTFIVAQAQANANKFEVCLVMNENAGIYFSSQHGPHFSERIPKGGIFVTDRMSLFVEQPTTADFLRRKRELETFIARTAPKSGFLLGDIRKGGRLARPEEFDRLRGRTGDGLPNGLMICPVCGDYRGECLDQNPLLDSLVVTVSCCCENDNLCARCGRVLYERKLNSNYYDPADGHIWHIPAFCGLMHRCSDEGETYSGMPGIPSWSVADVQELLGVGIAEDDRMQPQGTAALILPGPSTDIQVVELPLPVESRTSPHAMKWVPEGLVKCPVCGEYEGAVKAGALSWGEPFIEDGVLYDPPNPDPEKVLKITCLCDGEICRVCGKNKIPKWLSNTYDPETNTVMHWFYFSGRPPCETCWEKEKTNQSDTVNVLDTQTDEKQLEQQPRCVTINGEAVPLRSQVAGPAEWDQHDSLMKCVELTLRKQDR